MNYIYKAFLQSLLSRIPFGMEIQNQLRTSKIKNRIPISTLKQALFNVELLHKNNINIEQATVMEIGSGWKPIFPLIYRIFGAKKVYLYDTNRYITLEYLNLAIDDIIYYRPQIQAKLGKYGYSNDQNFYEVIEKFDNNFDLEVNLQNLGLNYFSPADARYTELEENSIDIFTSRAVLEHIPLEIISEIYQEAFRILKSNGVMIHLIDHSDHWSYFDKNISELNFLQLDGLFWNIINSPIAYQNRARSKEHQDLMVQAGFEIIDLKENINDGTLKFAIANKELFVEPYNSMETRDLAVSSSLVISKKKSDIIV